MKEIITDLEKLAKPAKPLEFITDKGNETDEGEAIIKELKEVMENDKTILALAAPQIGIDARIFCIRFNDVIKTFINPIITKKTGANIAPETFVSMPGKEILISRPNEVTVVYYTDEFKYEDNKLLGAAARLFDQQAQLLDGVLPDALGMVSDVKEDGSLADLTEEEINQLIEIYKQFVTIKQKALEESIKANEDEAKHYQQLKFTEKVINGDIQVVENPEETKARSAASKSVEAGLALGTKKAGQVQKAYQRANLINGHKNKRRGK